jgi:aromatic-amino-acid transaminase
VSHLIPARRGRPADDPIFALHKEATTRQSRGESIVDATIGVLLDEQGQLAVLPSAARAVREVPAVEWAAYAPIAGTPEFLRAVVDDLLGEEPDLRAAAVAVATPGGTGAIRNAIANFLEPGEALLTTNWFWAPYRTLCEESERRFETFAMFAPDDKLDVDALDHALRRELRAQKRALVVLNDPAHNPTGYSMSDDDWTRVARAIDRRTSEGPITLLVDCAYLLYGARDPRAFLRRLRPLLGKATVLFAWSASKSFTHYGLRVGALIACEKDEAERKAVQAALSYSCRGTWSNCNRGGLAAITRLLTDPHLAKACAAEREQAKALLQARIDAFNEEAHARGLEHPRYEGGFFVTVFVDRPHERAEAMRKEGVYVLPQEPALPTVPPGSSGQSDSLPPERGALRIALCSVRLQDVHRLVNALANSESLAGARGGKLGGG